MTLMVPLPLDAGPALHGVTLVGEHAPALENRSAQRRVVVRWTDIPLAAGAQPLWVREDAGARYHSRIALYPHPDGWLLSIDCEGKGRFLVRAAGIDVDWDGGTPPDHYLQTLGLALWLELRGVVCVHANLVARAGAAIGFVAPSQTGKTTLSSEFVRAGWHLLTDDMAALHGAADSWSVYPSRPVLRLWPDVGRNLHGGAFETCPPVHARFAKRAVTLPAPVLDPAGAQALRCWYLLARVDDPSASFTSALVGPAAAAIALLQNSILGDAFRALGIERQRLGRLAACLAAVPLVQLRYPSGLTHLADLRRYVEQDFRTRHPIAA